jgi:hypothetical protein
MHIVARRQSAPLRKELQWLEESICIKGSPELINDDKFLIYHDDNSEIEATCRKMNLEALPVRGDAEGRGEI